MKDGQNNGWSSYATNGNYWRQLMVQAAISNRPRIPISKPNFLSGNIWKIVATVTLALSLVLFALVIYNLTMMLPQSQPETFSDQTTTHVSHATTSQAQTTTALSQKTTSLAHSTTSQGQSTTAVSQTTTSQGQTTTPPSQTTTQSQKATTIFTTVDYHQVFRPYLPYGDMAGDSEYITGQGDIELDTTVRCMVLGTVMYAPVLVMKTTGATIKFQGLMTLNVFLDPFSYIEHIYYRKVTDESHISDISCLLNGNEVLEAFVFTWVNFTVRDAPNEPGVTVQAILAFLNDRGRTFFIRIYDELLPETNKNYDVYFHNYDKYNYETADYLAGKRIINDITQRPSSGGSAPEIAENRNCGW